MDASATAFRQLLNQSARMHVLGLGGAGMSGIARILHERGVSVSGCDRQDSPVLRAFAEEGVRVWVGHAPAHLNGAAALLTTSAAHDDHPEVAAARARGLPVFRRRNLLEPLLEPKRVLAVAGAHGKTTTTALLALALERAGLDPGFLVGGDVPFWPRSARWGTGDLFVIEADEYDRMFLGLRPWLAIITTVDHDHVDCYPTADDFVRAFADFAARVDPAGWLLLPERDPVTPLLREATSAQVETWGWGEPADWQVVPLSLTAAGSQAEIRYQGQTLTHLRLQLVGRHNLGNALIAFAAAYKAGAGSKAIAQACAEFTGVGRRFEVRGCYQGAVLVDDYAHHPAEVKATLQAARQRYPERRLVVVFQPHTYSRWRQFLPEFGEALRAADHLLITNIYAAREERPPDVAESDLLPLLSPGRAEVSGSLEATTERLRALVRENDVVLILGAGDCTRIADLMLT